VFSTGYLKKAAPSTQSRFPSPPTGSLLLLTLIRNFLRFFSFFFLHHTRRPHINSLLSAQTDLLDVHFAYPRTRCKNPGFIPFSFPSAPPEFLERNFTSENWWYHHLIYHQQLGFDLEKKFAYFIQREIWSWRFFTTRLFFVNIVDEIVLPTSGFEKKSFGLHARFVWG
jgi:hypothetical protein